MIRSASIQDAKLLTGISFQSKRYWGYPDSCFEIWRNELTVTPEYIEKNDVFVFESQGIIVGYYSLVTLVADIRVSKIIIGKGEWLDHMFVDPEHIGKGIGTKMFYHMRLWCETRGMKQVKILADPNARGFYEKMGCRYVREYPSTIPGRTTPLLSLDLHGNLHCP